jgi:hypothetical protein
VHNHRKYNIPVYHLAILVLLWLGIHILIAQQYGLRNLHDATSYIRRADYLLTHGRLEDSQDIFYLVPVSLLAFFRWLFPGQVLPYLFFQSVVSGFAAIALYLAGSKLFNNTVAGLAAGVIFLSAWDTVQWNTTTMTESLACSMICFTLYRLTYFSGSAKDYRWIIALLVINFLTRPTGIVIIVGTLAFLLHYYRHDIRRNYKLMLMGIPGLLMLAYWSADQMFTRWDFTEQYRKGNIVTYMDVIEGSALYRDEMRLDTTGILLTQQEPSVGKIVTFIVNNPVHFIKAACLKVYYLMTGIRPYYSNLHNAYILLWMLLIYTLYAIGWRTTTNSSVRFFTIAVIILNGCLIGISTVDWDNRFYIPMAPGIVLLAGGGAAYGMGLLKTRNVSENWR